MAHNCKSFDATFLVQAAEKNGVMDDLAQTVGNILLPERKSHSQENLVQDLLCKSYEAHNGLADVQTLYHLGPVVQKPINANPRLKINQGVYFSTPKCRSTLIFGRTLHRRKSILKNKNKQKKLSPKSGKRETNFTLILD